jgi:hypothetical protein
MKARQKRDLGVYLMIHRVITGYRITESFKNIRGVTSVLPWVVSHKNKKFSENVFIYQTLWSYLR